MCRGPSPVSVKLRPVRPYDVFPCYSPSTGSGPDLVVRVDFEEACDPGFLRNRSTVTPLTRSLRPFGSVSKFSFLVSVFILGPTFWFSTSTLLCRSLTLVTDCNMDRVSLTGRTSTTYLLLTRDFGASVDGNILTTHKSDPCTLTCPVEFPGLHLN